MRMQRKLIKLDGSFSNEPPEDKSTPSLIDIFASKASAGLRQATCISLKREFDRLHTRFCDETGCPKTLQDYFALNSIEKKVSSLRETIQAGGVAGWKAMREARSFVQDLRHRGLEVA